MFLLLRSEVKPVVCNGQRAPDSVGVAKGAEIGDVLIDGLHILSMVEGNFVTDRPGPVMVRDGDPRDFVPLGAVQGGAGAGNAPAGGGGGGGAGVSSYCWS